MKKFDEDKLESKVFTGFSFDLIWYYQRRLVYEADVKYCGKLSDNSDEDKVRRVT